MSYNIFFMVAFSGKKETGEKQKSIHKLLLVVGVIMITLFAGCVQKTEEITLNQPSTLQGQTGFTDVIIDSVGPAYAWGKGFGDMNGDGKTDLIAGGIGLYWYENPSWTKHTINSSVRISTDVEVIDLNRDGRNDVITIERSPSNAIFWYENTGSTWIAHYIANDIVHDIEISDFDSDGKVDIVARNQGSTGDSLYFYRQMNPTSWIRSTLTLSHSGEGLKVSDINRDGKPDIVVGSEWYKNTGTISSWIPYTYSASACANIYIDVGDINADGRLDIVISPSEAKGQYSNISWYEQPEDSQSSWIEHIIETNVEAVHHFVGVGDFNNDGKLDVASAMMEQGTNPKIKIYFNFDGKGSFGTPWIVANTSSHSMKVVDVDNSGTLSLYGADWNKNPSTPIHLWKNNIINIKNWTYILADNSRASQYFGLAAQDLTGDGLKDIISGKYFYRNPGGDMAVPWPRVTFPIDVDGLLSMDVDGDVYGDIIAMQSTGKIYWLEAQTKDGSSFNAIQVGDLGSADHDISTQGYALADITGDQKPEIIIVHSSGKYYFHIPNNPDGGNWPRTAITTELAEIEGIGAGDFDRDGFTDVCGLVGDNGLACWKNPGDGSSNWVKINVGSLPDRYADRVYLADMNGDGRLDLVCSAANGNSNGIYWFTNPGNLASSWTFNTVVNYGSTNSVNSLDVADIDHDGDIDIIAGIHYGTLKVSIWRNQGSGTFTENVIDEGHESHLGVRLFDLDRDGDLDIVSIAWDGYQNLHILRNDN